MRSIKTFSRRTAATAGLFVACSIALHAQITTPQLLDSLQHTAFLFFWNEANPANGLIKDRSAASGGGGAPSSIASVGFGLTALCIGVDHGWVGRAAARDRVLTTLRTFWHGPQGDAASGMIGHKGFFYHFLDMGNAYRAWNSELSTIDTALLFAGILYVREYFDGNDGGETEIRSLADSIYFRADWEWFRNFNAALPMAWKPGTNFEPSRWVGYNEAMIMYILGYGSPTHPLKAGWQAWTGGYQWMTSYGYSYVKFPPLFGHQYSHCWIDFRNIADEYMRGKGIDYFENSRRATLAQRAYCSANPGGWTGYSDTLWGLTACDGPNGYRARGAPPAQNDDGTIAPTAAIGSIVFAPEAVIPTIHTLWNSYQAQLWSTYGFRDAFNLTQNWWASDVIGIDQGPIIIMIENYRTGKVWEVFQKSPFIQTGLARTGFTAVTNIAEGEGSLPPEFLLHQNYPNPFNGQTTMRIDVPVPARVSLRIVDALGRDVETLVEGFRPPGSFSVQWSANLHPSGVYYARLTTGQFVQTRKIILLR